jgi:hypothetical protein
MITILQVPYAEKDKAKMLGAKWNSNRKTWYVEDVEDLTVFIKWIPAHLLKPYNQKNRKISKTLCYPS